MVDKDKNGTKETQVFKENGVVTRELLDVNGDGKPDSFMYYKNGLKFYRETDRNYDGKIDHWYYYDNRGYLLRFEEDTNNDGKPDRWTFCEDKLLRILQEQDRNFDGKVDRRIYNVDTFDSKIHSYRYIRQWMEADNNYDGIIDVFKAKKPAKGSKETPMADRTGQKMDTSYKTERPVKGGGGSKSSRWSIEDMLKERESREQQLGRQTGN